MSGDMLTYEKSLCGPNEVFFIYKELILNLGSSPLSKKFSVGLL